MDTDGFISLVEPAMIPNFLNDFLASPEGSGKKPSQLRHDAKGEVSLGLGPDRKVSPA
jgi:hypothetical protein